MGNAHDLKLYTVSLEIKLTFKEAEMWILNSSSNGLNWSRTISVDYHYISGEKFLQNAFLMIQRMTRIIHLLPVISRSLYCNSLLITCRFFFVNLWLEIINIPPSSSYFHCDNIRFWPMCNQNLKSRINKK